MDELFEKAMEIIETLPFEVQAKLMAIMDRAVRFIVIAQGLHMIFKAPLAKWFGKNMLAVFKKAGYDSVEVRTALAKWTALLWDMPDDWEVPWPLEPPVL